MKKLLVILVLSLAIISCSSDDNDNPTINQSPNTSYYKVSVDGNIESECTEFSSPISMINSLISTGNDIDFLLILFEVPAIGQTVTVDYMAWANAVADPDSDEPMVKIAGDNILTNSPQEYYMYSGTITRVSEYKITFTGIFKELLVAGDSHTLEGEIDIEVIF